jgi:hypothetical protein
MMRCATKIVVRELKSADLNLKELECGKALTGERISL